MSDVTINFRDGTKKTHKDNGRPGGSYTVRATFEGSFVVVTDCYGNRTAYPMDLVASVDVPTNESRW